MLSTTTRLSIVALLAPMEEVEFGAVRDATGLTDSNLSKQAAALEAADYLKIHKGYVGKRPRTWLALTPRGRHAFARHVEALKAIVATAGMALGPPGTPDRPSPAVTASPAGHPSSLDPRSEPSSRS